MKEAKVTITRRGSNKGDGQVSISIEDRLSGLLITEVLMDLSEFAESITGLTMCKGEFRFMPNQFVVDNAGKKRETKRILVEKPNAFEKEKAKEEVRKAVDKSGELKEGWMIHNDGTGSQQNGSKHQVVLYRFTEMKRFNKQ